jgi:hypothetical protein
MTDFALCILKDSAWRIEKIELSFGWRKQVAQIALSFLPFPASEASCERIVSQI